VLLCRDMFLKFFRSNIRKPRSFIFLIAIILFIVFLVWGSLKVVNSLKAKSQLRDQEAYQARFTYKDYTIVKGDVIVAILQKEAMLDYATTTKIIDSINKTQKGLQIKEGHTIKFIYFDGVFQGLTYDIDDKKFIKVTVANGNVNSVVEDIPYTVEVVVNKGTITTSFYADGVAVGLTPRVIMELAGVFAWDIDFVNSLYEGDNFYLVYEKLIRDGEAVGTRDILAARFTNDGTDYYAYRVVDEKGNIKYYAENGDAKKRLLLKTPLNFKRISSQFTRSRKHPVTGAWRAHKGIDLAASTGTPVESVGDGVVTYAGNNGGYGKFIKINHGQGFATAYAHLSKIYIKNGARVTQGQLIGAVGTTGTSTGPHLHYEMHKNGTVVHPFNTEVPKDVPIPKDLKPQLAETVAEYKNQLD
jgi:murein DD-endopeptidase MepM/ murein hydrolase activator NlpD